jgi:RHS repeat-associated protein
VAIFYGADGNRIKKSVSGSVTLYLVAQVNPTGHPQVVEELTVSGGTTNLNKVYTYGLDLISQKQISGSAVSFFGHDGLGSVRFLTGTNGAVSDTYVYEAYGTQITSSGSGTSNNYRFTGEQSDADLNMYYLRARYYKNGTGRFATMDSFEGNNEDALSLHKYLYAADNPVNNIDPSGETTDAISVTSGTAIALTLATLTGAVIVETKTHAIGNLLVAAYAAATTASIAIAAEEELVRPKTKAQFRRRVKEKTKNDGGSFIFLHGTSTGSFTDYASGKVDFTQGSGDFGAGFYTTKFPEGIPAAGKYAIERQATDGGTGIVLIFAMKASDLQSLRWKYMLPNRAAPKALYGVDYVYGPLGGVPQYKWEPGRGALQLVKGFRGFVPIPDLKNWRN